MARFWDFVSSEEEKDLLEVSSLRPTLFIGLGGFGCSVIRDVKTQIEELLEEHKDGFAFIGLDTHPKSIKDPLSHLEYVPLSIDIHPDKISKLYPKSLGFYKKLAGKWKARNITTGADKVKAVGRLAFRNPSTLSDYLEKLNDAKNQLRTFREHYNTELPIKVYIISTLAGGTGAGSLLDVFIVTKNYFNQEGIFNIKLQTLIITPEALESTAPSTDLPDFYANTYATLKEINYFITGKEDITEYDIETIGSLKITQEHIPNPIFIITNQNEEGTNIVSDIDDLRKIVVSYLLNEIKTPMKDDTGQPKPQDKENNAWGDPGLHGLYTAFSSMGVVQVGLPYQEVKKLFSLSILFKAIENDLSYQEMTNQIDTWIASNNLAEAGTDQLQEQIRQDKEGHNLNVKLDIEGEMADVNRKQLGKICQQKLLEKKAALENSLKNILQKHRMEIINHASESAEEEFFRLLNNNTVGQGVHFLKRAKESLKHHQTELLQELNEGKDQLVRLQQEVSNAIGNVVEAAQSGWIGRKNKIDAAVSTFGATLEMNMNQQLKIWSMGEAKKVYEQLIDDIEKWEAQWQKVIESMKSRLEYIKLERNRLLGVINRMANINRRGPGNRFSLIDSNGLKIIYEEYIGDSDNEIAQRTSKQFRAKNILTNTISNDKEWVNIPLQIIGEEVENRLQDLNILKIIEMFYPEDNDKRVLFNDLKRLGSPLFPLDANRLQNNYPNYWVVAVHPDLKDAFVNGLCAKYLVGEGLQHAFFETTYEVIIYSIQHGYTLWSLKRLDVYYSFYNKKQENYEQARARGLSQRPIHGWVHGETCEEIFPKSMEEEEAIKWFILGRAFSYLFPTALTSDGKIDEKKNKAFIYNRGSYYYIIPEAGKREVKLDQGLIDAFEIFDDHPEWQKRIQVQVESKILSEGASTVKDRLVNEYLPIVEEELEDASHDPEREKLLRDLLNTLNKFVDGLTQVRV